MKKRITCLLIGLLILSLAGSVTAFAALQNAPSAADVSESAVRKGAQKHKTLKMAETGTLQLTYAQTDFDTASQYQDYYVDAENNEYRFDEEGNFVGFSLSKEVLESKEKSYSDPIDQTTASELASQALLQSVGNRAAEFDAGECFVEDTDYYYFLFKKKYGASDWITGETCGIWVEKNGVVSFTSFPNLYDFESFDFTKLETVEKETVDELFEQQAKSVFRSEYKYANIKKHELLKENGKYYIKVIGEVVFSDHELVTLLEYKYALD